MCFGDGAELVTLHTMTHSKERVIDYLQDAVFCECVRHLVALDDQVLAQDLDGVEMVATLKLGERKIYSLSRKYSHDKISRLWNSL